MSALILIGRLVQAVCVVLVAVYLVRADLRRRRYLAAERRRELERAARGLTSSGAIVFRPFSVWVDGVKIGCATAHELSLSSDITRLVVRQLVPADVRTQDAVMLRKAFLQNREIHVAVTQIDGDDIQLGTMRVQTLDYATDFKTGVTHASAVITGGSIQTRESEPQFPQTKSDFDGYVVSAFQRKLAGDPNKLRALLTPAPKTLTLKPEQFASTWQHRPSEPIVIGLRVTSERDREGASIEALRAAQSRKLDDAETDRCVADAYARIITARGICDPNNLLAPHPLLPLPDDQIARAFPTSTIRFLFDEIDALNIAQSPGYSEATDDEIRSLVTILELDDPFLTLGRQKAARIRRLLWAALTELET